MNVIRMERMDQQGTADNSSQVEVTQMSTGRPLQPQAQVNDKKEQTDLTEAQGHTLKIPTRAGVLLWVWMG